MMRAEIQSKHPHNTCWLAMYFEEKAGLPEGLDKALAAVDWKPDDYVPPPPVNGMAEAVYISPGTAIFNGWTTAESGAKLALLGSVLRRFKIKTRRRKLGTMDLL